MINSDEMRNLLTCFGSEEAASVGGLPFESSVEGNEEYRVSSVVV